MQIFDQIPEVFFNFIITLLLALLIGFEQRKRQELDKDVVDPAIFGTDRTFSFIGVLGFILFILDSERLILFTAGAIVVSVFFAVFYYLKIVQHKSYGITSILVGLITYCLGPVVITQPKWLTILIAVSVLILVERKASFERLSKKFDISEFFTLGKFLIIAGVILPIAPRETQIPYINISPYYIWLTVVIVSSISYVSYILHRYVFPKAGLIISGVLGGLYSSTATTMVLSRRAKADNPDSNQYASSVIAATGMMYFRVLILMLIFNITVFRFLVHYIAAMVIISLLISTIVYLLKKPPVKTGNRYIEKYSNPLDLKIAVLFAVLFVLFSYITRYVLQNYGSYGLDVLSYVIGFTDIDPFLLNLFQGNYSIGTGSVAKAVLQAIASNNVLKAGYVFIFADAQTRKYAGTGLGIITLANIIFAVII